MLSQCSSTRRQPRRLARCCRTTSPSPGALCSCLCGACSPRPRSWRSARSSKRRRPARRTAAPTPSPPAARPTAERATKRRTRRPTDGGRCGAPVTACMLACALGHSRVGRVRCAGGCHPAARSEPLGHSVFLPLSIIRLLLLAGRAAGGVGHPPGRGQPVGHLVRPPSQGFGHHAAHFLWVHASPRLLARSLARAHAPHPAKDPMLVWRGPASWQHG
mmetsp:Transcript_95746/g.298155  ORF Transcript_95746/g.298155 Transcript_95746/m.298155 type:complete len:218 (-) Transcript_95746:26-679(-)